MPSPRPDPASSGAAVTALVVAMVSFQAGASIAKQVMPLVGAPGTTALRLGISALLVCVTQRPWRTRPSRAAARAVVPYGLALGTMNFVFYEALNRIPLGIAVGLEFTGPLAVAVMASRRRLDFVWVSLAVAGLILLLPLGRSADRVDPVGVGFALCAGVCWALYIVFGQKAGRLHGAAAASWGMLIAAAVVVPVGVADAGSSLFSTAVLPRGAAIAVLSSALPYTLEMIALRTLSTRTFGTLMSLEPALAAAVGLVVLGEHLSALQWLGIGAVIVASAGTLGNEQGVADLAGEPGAPA